MDRNFWSMIFEIVIFLPFILFLVFLTLKLGSGKLQGIQKGRFIRVHERTSLSKENNLLVVQMGNKGYVLASSSGRVEIIKEMEEEELQQIISQKTMPQYADLKDLYKKISLKRKGSQ
ncbi:MAG: flagellar biosynthetic protein FliO [Bacillota bacterium]|nr:flagellar biosynthetic protein FliO [Bacillota bacterium]